MSIFIFSWLVTCVCPPSHIWRSFLTTYGACPSRSKVLAHRSFQSSAMFRCFAPWSWYQPVRCLNSSLTSCCIRRLASSHSVCLFSYFFACHEHFDSLKTQILTRCKKILSFLRVLSSCLFHDPVFSLINVPTMRDAVISCSHLLSSSLSHLEWDEVTLTRGRRSTTSAESGRLLPFGRGFRIFLCFSCATCNSRKPHLLRVHDT